MMPSKPVFQIAPVKLAMKSVALGNTFAIDAMVRNWGPPTSSNVYSIFEGSAADRVVEPPLRRSRIHPKERDDSRVDWRGERQEDDTRK